MDSSEQRTIDYPEQSGTRSGNRILLKALIIGALILLLLIPAAFIANLVQERAVRQQQVVQEVSSKWAQAQTIKGPVLLIPYLANEIQGNKQVTVRHNAFFTPERLTVSGNIDPEIRHRSIYDVTLYKSQLQLAGSFSPVNPALLGLRPENMLWNEAMLLTGINDLHGLDDEVQLQWNGASGIMEPGLPAQQLFSSGLNRRCIIEPGKDYVFQMTIKIKGSQALLFAPIAKTTQVHVNSSWQHPSFEGQFLPATSETGTAKGFSADWKISQTSSGIPSAFKDLQKLDTTSFGVRLLQPADGYAKTERSVKYALLFISLTFALFFFSELYHKKQVHPLQYLLVGLALCIFYTLLLSITEYSSFNTAYLIAAAATITLISMYVQGLFHKGKMTALISAALSGLYSYIFIIIQLEDYALLFGSIGLFVLLAVIMYYSGKIDWYGSSRQPVSA